MIEIIKEIIMYYLLAGVLLVYCGNKFVPDCQEIWTNSTKTDRLIILLGWLPVLIWAFFAGEDV